MLELVARSIAWWRVHHHGISAVTHPALFRQRVMSPGGISAELLALIDLVNPNVNLANKLHDYLASNSFLINADKLTNTGKVISTISDAFLNESQNFNLVM
jgi:hypothetical protein